MSEKRLDAKNRWRNVVVAFRMSPEEAQELNVKVSLSGLSKQDYIIQCLLKHEIRVVGGMKVAKKVQVHLDTILEELQTLDESDRGIDVEELLVPLKHVLDILQSDEKGVAYENGTERPLTADELLDEINMPEVEYEEDGTVWVYYLNQKMEITDKFEDGVCFVQLKADGQTQYITVKYQNGYATSPDGYIQPDKFN